MGRLTRYLRDVFRAAATALLPGPPTVSQVPEYPLRCQHCTSPIRLGARPARGEPIYLDAFGHHTCTADTAIIHKPMPSILG